MHPRKSQSLLARGCVFRFSTTSDFLFLPLPASVDTCSSPRPSTLVAAIPWSQNVLFLGVYLAHPPFPSRLPRESPDHCSHRGDSPSSTGHASFFSIIFKTMWSTQYLRVFVSHLATWYNIISREATLPSALFPVELHHPGEYWAWRSCSVMIIFLALNASALQCGFYFPFGMWIWHVVSVMLPGVVGLRVTACRRQHQEEMEEGLLPRVPNAVLGKIATCPRRRETNKGEF